MHITAALALLTLAANGALCAPYYSRIPFARRALENDRVFDLDAYISDRDSAIRKSHKNVHALQRRRQKRDWQPHYYERRSAAQHLNLAKRQSGGNTTSGAAQLSLTTGYLDDTTILIRGAASVGTPAQNFQINFDTGSSDFWLTSPTSGTVYTPYNADNSSTVVDTGASFSIPYLKGDVAGEVYRDTIIIAGFRVTNQSFGVADQITSNYNSPLGFDGLMGLAFTSALGDFNDTSFMETLVINDVLQSPIFSFYVGRAANLTGFTPGTAGFASGAGELCIGCINSDLFTGDLNFVNLTYPAFWEVPMDGMSVNGAALSNTSSTAIIDSGTSFIYMPSAITEAVFDQIPGSQFDPDQGFYTAPCTTSQQIAITFGGQSYDLSMEDLNAGRISFGSSLCVFAIAASDDITGADDAPAALIGTIFQLSVYTVFNYEGSGSVGFAPSRPISPTTQATFSTINPALLTATPVASASLQEATLRITPGVASALPLLPKSG